MSYQAQNYPEPAAVKAGKPRKPRAPRAHRFPVKFELFGPDAMHDAFKRLELAGLLNRSDHMRQAFDWYLRQVDPQYVQQMAARAASEHLQAAE